MMHVNTATGITNHWKNQQLRKAQNPRATSWIVIQTQNVHVLTQNVHVLTHPCVEKQQLCKQYNTLFLYQSPSFILVCTDLILQYPWSLIKSESYWQRKDQTHVSVCFCVHVYVCVCVCVCVCVSVGGWELMYLHEFVHACRCVCVGECICEWFSEYVCVYVCICVSLCMYVCICVYLCVCVFLCLCVS